MATIKTDNAIVYKDVFTKGPSKNAIYNVEAIRQSVENILFVRIGEMPFLRNFGSEIESLLYETINEITAQKIYHYMINAIDKWEPRISINNSRSNVIPDKLNYSYEVQIVYSIVGFEGQYYSITGSLRPKTNF